MASSCLRVALILLLTAAFHCSAGEHGNGFLAVDKGRRLWDAFQHSEKKLNLRASISVTEGNARQHSSESVQAHGTLWEGQPAASPSSDAAQESSDLAKWQELQEPTMWLSDGPILTINYSIPVMRGTPPCAEKIENCLTDTRSCQVITDELQHQISEAMVRLHHLTNHHPLLNTLAIKAVTHQKASIAPSSQILKPPKQLDHIPGGLLPAVLAPSWPLRGPPGKAPTKESIHQLSRNEIPRRIASNVAVAVANDIASELPDHDVHNVAKHVNSTCTGDQVLELDDCMAYIQACKDTVSYHDRTLHSLRTQIRDHEVEQDGEIY
jgi:hypothetical protein